MEKNTQLPKEVVEEIKTHAIDYANGIVFNSVWMNAEKIDEKRAEASEDYQAGATAYAAKLIECDNTNRALEEKIRGLEEKLKSLEEQLHRLEQERGHGGVEGESDAVSFAEWAATIAFFDDGTRLWELMGEGEAINGQFRFATNEFFELFKQQKENP